MYISAKSSVTSTVLGGGRCNLQFFTEIVAEGMHVRSRLEVSYSVLWMTVELTVFARVCCPFCRIDAAFIIHKQLKYTTVVEF